MRQKRLLRARLTVGVFALWGIMAVAACASLPVKEQAVKTTQTAEIALGAAQDFERATFASGTAPWLTVERHQAISRAFSTAFGTQVKLAIALDAWRAGDPKPADIDQLTKDVNDTLKVIQAAIADNPKAKGASDLLAKVQTIVDEVAKLAASFGGRK